MSVSFVKFKGWGHLREKEVGDDEEEEGTSDEDIVVVLLDFGKCTGSSLGDWFRGLLVMALPQGPILLTRNVDNKMRGSGETHDFAAQSNG